MIRHATGVAVLHCTDDLLDFGKGGWIDTQLIEAKPDQQDGGERVSRHFTAHADPHMPLVAGVDLPDMFGEERRSPGILCDLPRGGRFV